MRLSRSASDALDALASLRFSWAATPDDVWDPAALHVDGLQSAAERALLLGMDDAWQTSDASPIGLAITGAKGVGKTHLLGWLRRQVQGGQGFFFLVQVLAGAEFWRSVVQGVLDGLFRPAQGARDQLTLLLSTLADRTGASPDLREVLAGDRPATRAHLDALVMGLRRLDRQVGTESSDAARALVLYNSPDLAQSDAGRAWLAQSAEIADADRVAWGLQRTERSPQLVVRDLSRLIALTGQPTVIAVDQLDTLIAQSRSGGATRLGTDEDDRVALVLDSVADGLMAMREETRRTLTVLSVLPASWRLVRRYATSTAADRFREFPLLDAVPSADVAADLLAAYLGRRYEAIGFDPPYPTWPVARRALDQAARYTARELLQRVDEHARGCVDAGEVHELVALASPGPPVVAVPRAPAHAAEPLDVLDADFELRRARADVALLLDAESEDVTVPVLLRAALTCFVEESRGSGRDWAVDPLPPPRRPPLHARLRLVLDPATEDERHWAFRAVLEPHHRSAASRLDEARIAAGVAPGIAKRRLVALTSPAPSVPRDGETVVAVALDHDDVRTFEALREMIEADPPGMREWLAARRPATRSALLAAVLTDLPAQGSGAAGAPAPGATASTGGPVPVVLLGRTVRSDAPVTVPLPSLARHVLVAAGAASGRWDVVRHLVDQVDAAGVPTLMVERGDAVPEPGQRWRALPLGPVPDLAVLRGDPEGLAGAVTATVAALAPAAGVAGDSPRAHEGRQLLGSALEACAHASASDLAGVVAMLRELPADLHRGARGRRLARETADTLDASVAANGARPDVAAVLAALFPWIAAHPAPDAGLSGLLALDEAHVTVPSGPTTDGLVALLAHARRYGFAVVVATSSPRALDVRIPPRAATHALGLLHSPAQIEAARDIARARVGVGDVPDVARLTPGTFAVATEATSFEPVRLTAGG